MATTEPIRSKSELKELSNYFLQRGQIRNYVLVILGTCTALRISDLLRLRWTDVYDSKREMFRERVAVTEQKTGKTKTIALNKQVIRALRLYFPYKRSDFIFVSNRRNGKAISRVQAWRIIHAAVVELGIMGKIACHSLRKTWGYHAIIDGDVSLAVVVDIYNHSSYETTKLYLGIRQDERDEAILKMTLF